MTVTLGEYLISHYGVVITLVIAFITATMQMALIVGFVGFVTWLFRKEKE